jgi:hypothetical protein
MTPGSDDRIEDLRLIPMEPALRGACLTVGFDRL